MSIKRAVRWRAVTVSVGAVALAAGAAACSSGSSSSSVAASATQTIVFAESGLGTEGQQTQVAINAFEKANPNIKVTVQVLSTDSTTYLSQLEHDFISGSSTPDVFESDVTYPAKFAQAGWVLPLTQFNPNTSQFFAHEVAAGTYNGTVYAMPWFDNPEGLFYRTDLIKTPPTSPAQVVSDAEAAMKADKSLKEGIAFEADKYEGAITAFLTVDSAFGGTLDPSNVNTAGNVAALKWLHDAIYISKIAPQAVTGWQEGQVEEQFASGSRRLRDQLPVRRGAAGSRRRSRGTSATSRSRRGPGGTPGSALGGEMLAINAKTAHAAAAYKLIQYLTSPRWRPRGRSRSATRRRCRAPTRPRCTPSRAVLRGRQDAEQLLGAPAGDAELPAGLHRPADAVLLGVRQREPERGVRRLRGGRGTIKSDAAATPGS